MSDIYNVFELRRQNEAKKEELFGLSTLVKKCKNLHIELTSAVMGKIQGYALSVKDDIEENERLIKEFYEKVDRIDERYKNILTLLYCEGLSVRNVAAVMGKSDQWIFTLKNRALEAWNSL